MTGTTPLTRQIACVEREIRRRERVYPTRVNTGRMRQREATEELAIMREVLATLRGVAQP